MATTIDERALAELLPGTWTVAATNFPMWLNGQRRDPRFGYELISAAPLVLRDEVSFERVDGQRKCIRGTDSWRSDQFVWRGAGLLALVSSRWRVAGINDEGTVVALRFSKSALSPAGVDVIVREGAEHSELRAMIAHSTEQFGLSPEEFGSLTWLEGPRPAS